MKKRVIALTAFFVLGLSYPGMAMDDASHGEHDREKTSGANSGTYFYEAVVDGIRGEFQIMSLASMNMKDPEGATHHIMVKFYKDGMNHQIKEAVGEVQTISPSKKKQVGRLKNYNGIFAANLTFSEMGKYDVICSATLEGMKIRFTFSYPHS